MIRLVHDTAATSEREDAETAASAQLLRHWVRAVTRNAVLSGKLPNSFLGPNPIERPKT